MDVCVCVCVQNMLTFVAVRLFLPRGATRLPKPIANALYQVVAMVAQQFEGYIFTVNIDEVTSPPPPRIHHCFSKNI